MVELIQEALGHSGIEVKLSRLEFAQWIQRVDDWQFEATMGGWALDINGDPSQIWSSDQADLKKSSNFLGYKNAQADQLIAAGRLEYDDAKRAAIYQQLHQVIHDDYPCCFLFQSTRHPPHLRPLPQREDVRSAPLLRHHHLVGAALPPAVAESGLRTVRTEECRKGKQRFAIP